MKAGFPIRALSGRVHVAADRQPGALTRWSAAVEGDSVLGFAWVIMTRALDRAAYLRLLLVAETHQSRGLGAALLARAEHEARASRCRHLVLLVTRTNRRARSFYVRHGYAHVGDLAGFVRPGIAESLYLKSWRA